MRRHTRAGAAAAAVLAAALLVACGNDAPATPPADAEQSGDQTMPDGHDEPTGTTLDVTPKLAADLAAMRTATARYANDLDAAIADGYFTITQMIDDMGHHFLNPDFSADGFDPAEPPILVYHRDGDDWQLVAVEWVFPEEPAVAPLDGATYGSFPAACHYQDGLFAEAAAEDQCAASHPDSGAGFTFWHPDLVTLHAWIWLHNPDGLYHGTNPLMSRTTDRQPPSTPTSQAQ